MWPAPDLRGRVALVAGASRGIGRGIADVLAECGATVLRVSRSSPDWPCDLGDDAAVESLLERVAAEHGRLDVLVANAVGWDGTGTSDEERAFMVRPPWFAPMDWWDQNFHVGVRSHFLLASRSVRLLRAAEHGLLVFTGERRPPDGTVGQEAVLEIRAAAVERMAEVFAHHLRPRGVASLLLYPGFSRTEAVEEIWAVGSAYFEGWSTDDYLDRTCSVAYAGRAVAAMAADPAASERWGPLVTTAEAAEAYGFTDVDGRRPNPI